MDVVTVDYGEPLTGFVMKENRNHVSHYKDPHIESEIIFTGFAL